jgi:LuxR family maltose regulon positive regulatory protein
MSKADDLPILRTKLLIPEMRHYCVPREVLLTALDERDFGDVVLICAPAGYGKTSFAAEWARMNGVNIAWLTLEPADNDLDSFTRYFAAALARNSNMDQLGEYKQEDTANYPTEEALHTLMIRLINCYTQDAADATLVLDNFQFITQECILEEIAFLLDHFPPHLRLILLTRKEPDFSLSRLRATAHLLEIRVQQLAFNFSETSQFLRVSLQRNISDEDLLLAYQKTEGWVLGLQLLPVEYLTQKSQDRKPFHWQHIQALYDYFRDEVISAESSEVQEFLIKTSQLDRMNAALCEALFADEYPAGWSRKMLQILQDHNLFTFPDEEHPGWLRYHSLFAEVLREEFLSRYPTESKEYLVRASTWFMHQHMLDESVQQILRTEDADLIIAHLENVTVQSLQDGRVLDLMHIIRTIDEDTISASPILCLAYAWDLLENYDFESCELWMEKAMALSHTPEGEAKITPFRDIYDGIIKMMQAILLSSRGQADQADVLIDEALEILPQDNYFSRSFAMLHHAVAHAIEGRTEEAIALYQQAIQIAQLSEQWFVQLLGRYQLARIYERIGRFKAAEIELMRSLAIFSRLKGKYTNLECYLYKELAVIHIARNELEDAWEDFQNYLDASPLVKSSPDDVSAHIFLAQFHHANQDPGSARFELSLAQQLSGMTEGWQDDMDVQLAALEMELQRNMIENVERWFRRQNEKKLETLPITYRLRIRLLFARLLLAQGRRDKDAEKLAQSRAELEELLPILQKIQNIALQIKAYILLAEAAAELENEEQMLEELGTALMLAEPEEIRQYFLDEGLPMSRMLLSYLAAIKQGRVPSDLPSLAFVSDLIFRMTGKPREDRPKDNADEMEDVVTIELLTPREVEVLQLVARGRTNAEIAQDLVISVNTVKRHLNNMFMKLGVTTRIQAVRVARQRGLI